MQISSPAFANNETIPVNYTCDGPGVNPPLEIAEVPEEAQSLVLIVDDPDAPNGTFTHWLVWDLPPTTTEIPEDFNKKFVPPCPPSGIHHYHFKLYALSQKINPEPDIDREELEEMIRPLVLANAGLVGLYSHDNFT